MREYGTIAPTFWTRGTGKALRGKPAQQLVALYLVSAPTSNMIGLYYIPIRFIAHEIGLSVRATKGALKALASPFEGGQEPFLWYDETAETVFVRTMARRQLGLDDGDRIKDKDNRTPNIVKMMKHCTSANLLQRFWDEYHEVMCLPEPWWKVPEQVTHPTTPIPRSRPSPPLTDPKATPLSTNSEPLASPLQAPSKPLASPFEAPPPPPSKPETGTETENRDQEAEGECESHRDEPTGTDEPTEPVARTPEPTTEQPDAAGPESDALVLEQDVNEDKPRAPRPNPKESSTKRKREIATPLPPGWKPNEDHYRIALEEGGKDRAWVDRQAVKMRDWAEANMSKEKGRKSNWNAAFRGQWIRGSIEREHVERGNGFPHASKRPQVSRVQPATGRVFGTVDQSELMADLKRQAEEAGIPFQEFLEQRHRRIVEEYSNKSGGV